MSNTSKPIPPNSDPHLDDQSLPEEYAAILARGESQEEEESTRSEECYCSFFDQGELVKTSLEEYQQGLLKDIHLFSNVLTLEKDEDQICIEKPSSDPNDSILVTGFGIRNVKSLEDALRTSERKRLYELYKSEKQRSEKQRSEKLASEKGSSASVTPSSRNKISFFGKRTIETETAMSSASSNTSIQQEKLLYLMGLEAEKLEEEEYPQEADLLREMFEKESEDKFIFSKCSTTRSAQTYLRSHRIFDFFQFIIAHLLSAAPDNPITFILVLLNKILLYRAGTGHPPLLYQRKHIEQLFVLMDRMNTGYIDPKQYVSGMNTLGICEYNKNPPLSEDGLVSKEVFVVEALEGETALFNDLIKKKWTGHKPSAMRGTFSDMGSPIRSFISVTPFIPSDLFRTSKHFPSGADMVEGNANE